MPIIIYKFFFIKIFSRNHNFRYFNSSILSLLRLSLKSKIVHLISENIRFDSKDIIDIEKTLIVIFDSRGYLIRYLDFSYYLSAIFSLSSL